MNVGKLFEEASKCKPLQKNEIEIREVIEIVSEYGIKKEDIEKLLKKKDVILNLALEELSKPLEKMDVVRDMIVGEYLKENISTSPIYDDGDDIY